MHSSSMAHAYFQMRPIEIPYTSGSHTVARLVIKMAMVLCRVILYEYECITYMDVQYFNCMFAKKCWQICQHSQIQHLRAVKLDLPG